VGLRCSDGPVAWNVALPVTVQVFAPAVVASVTLPAGAQLAQDQLIETEVDWAASPQPPLTGAKELAGRTLVRTLTAGQAVRAADLQARQWVAAGDTVRVITTGGGFAASGEGLAQATGLEGQTVRVRMGNDRVLTGRVVGQRLVEVAL
jgi:flagella basal body P-ring formation protein FlgA